MSAAPALPSRFARPFAAWPLLQSDAVHVPELRRRWTFPAVIGLVAFLATPATAGEPKAEFRFGAIVVKDDVKLPIPGALVTDDGSAVTIGRRSEDPKKPGFNIKCRIERTAPGKLSAHFTAFVDKQDVASETIALDRALKELVLKAPPYSFAIEIAPFEKGGSPLTSARLLDEQLKTAEAQHDKEILARAGLRGETRFKASWAKFTFSHPKAWTIERMTGSSMMMTLVDPEKLERDGAHKTMAGVALFAAQLDWPAGPESDRPQALREMATMKHDDEDEGSHTTTVSAPILVKVGGLVAYAVDLADPSRGSGGRTYYVAGKYKIYQLSFTYYDSAAPALTPAQQKVLGSFRELAR
jgi:hypothetical protein